MVHGQTDCSGICAEVIQLMDRVYAAEGPDEPDLGMNVAYFTARRSLQRLATAAGRDVPPTTVRAIRARLQAVTRIHDPHRLESELLSFPAWVLALLERRTAGRLMAGEVPHRRAGDRP